MIGDWVDFYHPYEPEKKIVTRHRITDIYGSCLGGLVGISNRNNPVHVDHIEPIKITPEILEKNGFIRDPLWHHCDKDLDNYSISVQLGYANRIEYIKIVEKGKDNVIPSERTKMYLTHIKYIHELQRALRLCGIENEIVL